jgi:outer membrane lipoprotein-sorting protein
MRFVLILFLALALAPLPSRAADSVDFTPAERTQLARISAYLNSIPSLTARFLQLNPDGTPVEGTFYLMKPGRLRFEYDKPSPLLVIADGYSLVVQNLRLRTTDRYPLFSSPLRLLLREEIDLADDDRIRGVHIQPGAVSVVARQESGPSEGQITLTFADSGGSLELRQWLVIDAQGMRTIVIVKDLRTGVDLSPQLFVVKNLRPRARAGGRPRTDE